MDDEELLQHFDCHPKFKRFRTAGDWPEGPLFCRLVRAVHNIGLDWWYIRVSRGILDGNVNKAIRLRFGRKEPNGDATIHIGHFAHLNGGQLNGFRFNESDRIAQILKNDGLQDLKGQQPLTQELVERLENWLAGGPAFQNGATREAHGLLPDQYLNDGEPEPGGERDVNGVAAEARQRAPLSPTNVILYGPPGTGKTFSTAAEAVRFCGEPVPEGREDLMQAYRQLVAAGRIEFVTFHQSMSYEDFVEGRQPVTGADEDDDTAYTGFRLETVPGIFRRIARRAETCRGRSADGEAITVSGRQIFKMSIGEANNPEDAHLFEEAIDGDYTLLGFGDVDWSDDKYTSREAIIEAQHASGGRYTDVNAHSGAVKAPFIFRNWVRKGDIVIVSKGNLLFRAIGEFTGDYEFHPRPEGGYAHRRAVRWLWVDRKGVPVSEIYSRRFTQNTIYALYTDEIIIPALERYLNGRQEAFVLIIDEINRANISKVFGELITLLEPDKRLGQPNELKVRLPYSGDEFGVPSNLHILGTMNTADRSIALLDTALRRRFTFREILPDPSMLAEAAETCGLDLPRVLETLNERIEYLYDREHRIGHAYFIDCEAQADVDAVMRHKVIPLLAEYFFEDWEKVAAVLGDAAPHDGPIAGGFLNRSVLRAPPGLEDGDALPRFRWMVRSEDQGFNYTGLVEA